MLTLLLFSTIHAAPAILDAGDASYMAASKRAPQASAWYLERMLESPDETQWLTGYLGTLSWMPSQRSPVLVELVEDWRDRTHAGDAGAAVAMARSLSSMRPTMRSSHVYLSDDTSYCADAVEDLTILPDDPAQRYRVLAARISLPAQCGVDRESTRQAQQDLALTGDAGVYPRALFGSHAPIGAETIAAIELVIEERPWRIANLGVYFNERSTEDRTPAQHILLASAAELATSDQPSRVFAAARLFQAAGQRVDALATFRRVQSLDPTNPRIQSIITHLEHAPKPGEAESAAEMAPDVATLFDPSLRLAALKARKPAGKNSGEQRSYWRARVDAARGVGDDAELLDALEQQWRHSEGFNSNLEFAELAVKTGKRLRKAEAAMQEHMRFAEMAPPYRLSEGEDWREFYSQALEVEARVLLARGKNHDAIKNLERALALRPPTPSRLIELGLLYNEQGRYSSAHPLLAAGLAAHGHLESTGKTQAMDALTDALQRAGVWNPGSVESWIAAMQRRRMHPEPNEALDSSMFNGFQVLIDGAPHVLLDIEGPVVVELWATWCGPCLQLLPHIDDMARRYKGEVTFLAVSVDSSEAKAKKYLEKRGETFFTPAYAKDGMEELGVSLIPAVFVFDANHQLVARLSGMSPGNRELHAAVEAMLGK